MTKFSLLILTSIFLLTIFSFLSQKVYGSQSLSEKEKSLLWFVEEVLIKENSKNLPAKLTNDLTLTGMDSLVENGKVFLVSDLVINATKENFQIPVEEFKRSMKEQLIIGFCSQVDQKEYIFKGFSEVGNINRYFDSAFEFVAEIKVGLIDC